MKKIWSPLLNACVIGLAGVACTLAPVSMADAQEMEFSLDEADSEMTFDVDEDPPPDEAASGGSIFDDPIEDDDGGDDGPIIEGDADENAEEIYAIQRVYALRRHRVEMAPSIAVTLNDPYQAHIGAGLGLNYWFTNVLAIGANAIWYQMGDVSGTESDTSFYTRRSTRLGIPLTEWQAGAWLNFTYVPVYGKFAAFNRFIFEWDTYLVGGIGMLRTRPIPVFDPSVREFDWGTRVSFNAGLGIRVFISRWLTLNFEFRDYIFLERYENTRIPVDRDERADPGNWLSPSATVTHNAAIQAGLTFFFPPSFEYELPK